MTTRRSFIRLLAGAGFGLGTCAAAGCRARAGDLNIGVSCGLVPWCYIDGETGLFTGFDVELARLACARLRLTPVFHAIVWAEKERLLATRKIDCVWSAFAITGRMDRYAVLGPYASNALAVLVRTESPIVRNDDLAGKTVLVQHGSTSETVFSPQGRAAALGARLLRLRTFPSVVDFIPRLREGVGDAAVVDEDMARIAVRENAGKLRIVADQPLAREEFGIGFRPGDDALRSRLDRVLRKLEAEGVCAELSQRFFGRPDRFALGKEAK